MADPDTNGTLISPAIDDELIVTVRIHVADMDGRTRLGAEMSKLVPTIGDLVRPLLDGEDDYLAGIEIAMPTFRPYHTVYQRNDQPLPEIG